jgi:glycosyltransferase involved in cell wall biosynthesis
MKVDRATVLVCTYNRAPHLRQTIEALRAMNAVPDCDVDIIVVDNNSTDNTPAVVAEAARDPGIPAGQELRAQPRPRGCARPHRRVD